MTYGYDFDAVDRIEQGMVRQLKLVSKRDTLLGTITLPPEWHRILFERDKPYPWVEFTIMERQRSFHADDFDRPVGNAVRQGAIGPCYSSRYPDGFQLYGLTVEEFEKIPGCTFSPSAAYVRSLLEE